MTASVGRRGIVATIAALTLVLTAFVQSVGAAPKPDPRIIGGEPADFGEYPFMVALLFEPTAGNDFQKQYCGGSLIASRWVLTAAHCLDFLESPDEVAVAVSRTNLDSTEGQRVAVRDFFIHPDYDPNVISPDVGLIQLARPVTGVQPIQLAGATDDGFEAAGTPLTVIGWGNTSTTGQASFPNELREVVVPVVADAECDFAYHGIRDRRDTAVRGAEGHRQLRWRQWWPAVRDDLERNGDPGRDRELRHRVREESIPGCLYRGQQPDGSRLHRGRRGGLIHRRRPSTTSATTCDATWRARSRWSGRIPIAPSRISDASPWTDDHAVTAAPPASVPSRSSP